MTEEWWWGSAVSLLTARPCGVWATGTAACSSQRGNQGPELSMKRWHLLNWNLNLWGAEQFYGISKLEIFLQKKTKLSTLLLAL